MISSLLLLVGKLDFVQCPVKVYVHARLLPGWAMDACMLFPSYTNHIHKTFACCRECRPTRLVVRNQGFTIPPPLPPWIFGHVWKHLIVSIGRCYYCHLIGRVQGCCQNIIQCTGQPPTGKNRSKMSKGRLLRNPALNIDLVVPSFVSQCKNRHGFTMALVHFILPLQ